MSLLTVLKTVGKDLSNLGNWIEDGLAIAAPIVAVVDPPLASILAEVEAIIAKLESPSNVDAKALQGLTTAVTVMHAVNTNHAVTTT